MKVLFDHQIFCTQRFGGFSRYFNSLAHALGDIEGVTAKIAAPAHINGYLDSQITSKFSFALPIFKRGLNHRVRAVAPLFRLAASSFRPELVHETHYIMNGSHLPKSAAVVATCHDMIVEKGLHQQSEQLEGIKAKRMALERSDFIICISKNTQDDLLNIYPHLRDRTTVVHHGVQRVMAQNRHGTVLPAAYLLYVGVRRGYKNFSQFLRAFANSPTLNAELEIVCFGGEPFSNEDMETIKQLAIPREKVHFLSGSDEFLAHVYTRAAALIYPSAYEGFGMPVTEAMIQGCPVITSRSSSLPEVCLDAAQYFDPDDPEEMGNAIEAVVFDAARRKQLVEAGFARSKAFTWEACASKTLDAYRVARGMKTDYSDRRNSCLQA